MLNAMLYCLKVTVVFVGEAYFAAFLAAVGGYVCAQAFLFLHVENPVFLGVMLALGSLPLFMWWFFLIRKGFIVLAGMALPLHGIVVATFFHTIYGAAVIRELFNGYK